MQNSMKTFLIAAGVIGLTATGAMARPVVAFDVGGPIGIGIGVGPGYDYYAPDYYAYPETAYYSPAWDYDYAPVVTYDYAPVAGSYNYGPAFRGYRPPYYRAYAAPEISAYGEAPGAIYGRRGYARYSSGPRYASVNGEYARGRGYTREHFRGATFRERQTASAETGTSRSGTAESRGRQGHADSHTVGNTQRHASAERSTGSARGMSQGTPGVDIQPRRAPQAAY
jgi:hypothetical protein